MMTVEVIKKGDLKVGLVHIHSELTSATVDEFRYQIAICMGKGVRHYVINLALVDFIDSSGLGALISILARLRELNGDIKLSDMQPGPKKIFQITRADNYFCIYESHSEAIETMPFMPLLR